MSNAYTNFLNLTKPEPGQAVDIWGTLLNTDLDQIDAGIKTVSLAAAAASALAATMLPLAGGTLSGTLNLPVLAIDPTFTLSKNGSLPIISVDSNDYIVFDRPNNTFSHVVAGATILAISGSAVSTSVPINIGAGPSAPQHATPKSYVDAIGGQVAGLANSKLALTGGTLSGVLNITNELWLSTPGPVIRFNDTDWGQRSLYSDGGNIGFLNNGGGYAFFSANDGSIYSSAYGYLHDQFVRKNTHDTINSNLTVNGSMYAGAHYFTADTDTGIFSPGDGLLGFLINGQWKAHIDAGGTVYANGNFVVNSDRKLKTNILTIKNPLDMVGALRGVSYQRIDQDMVPQLGFVAQEVQQVIPEAVFETGNDDTLGVNYQMVIPVLVEAIKVLTKRVAELEAR